MSIFEAIMLLCFGMAWPFSILKSWRTKRNEGKSLLFLWIVFIGYVSGVIHKLLYSLDIVTGLYALNGLMVFIDLCLYYRNRALQAARDASETASPEARQQRCG